MEQLTLSVCLIVRNEEALLGRCLASLQGLADEIVVVDTGSTDRTIEIAQALGAKVFPRPWPHDFAAARNLSLELASGDWILVIDADEWLAPGGADVIRHLMNLGEAGWGLRIRSFQGDAGSADADEHYMMRLFPNRPYLRFVGVIHEQLHSSDPDQPLLIRRCQNLALLHDGYRPEVVERQDKQARNRALLERAVEQEPDQRFHWFNLATNYLGDDDPRAALHAFERCLDGATEEDAFLVPAWIQRLGLVAEAVSPEAALALLPHMPVLCEQSPDYWITHAGILQMVGCWQDALASYERAAMFTPDQLGKLDRVNLASVTWKPYLGMAQVWLALGHPETAVIYLCQALEHCPVNPLAQELLDEIAERLPFLATR